MTNFVEKYVAYAKDFTDAPELFHEAMAYFCVSSVVANRCRLDIGQYGLFPVLWVLLVAPSGFYRKSTALSIAQNLIMTVDPMCAIGSQFKERQLITALASQGSACTFFGEFERLAVAAKGTLGSTLTEMFDCPPYLPCSRYKMDKAIVYPFFNIAAAATSSWLSSITPRSVSSGFIPRFLVVTTQEKETIMPMQKPHDKDRYAEVTRLLNLIRLREGLYRYSPEAEENYCKWYTLLFDTHCKSQYEVLDPFLIRISDYAHKFALLHHLANGLNGYTVSVQSSIDGCALAEKYLNGLKGALKLKCDA